MLYLLRDPSFSSYHCMKSCVVAAASETDARMIATANADDEGKSIWLNLAHCQFIGEADLSVKGLGLLCRDFN